MKKKGLMKNKKAQFYLITAIIISIIVIGLITVSNYLNRQEFVRIHEVGEELKLESEYVFDTGISLGYSDTQMKNLSAQFIKDYISYAGDEKNLYFVFGDKTSITFTGYSQTSTVVSVKTNLENVQVNLNAKEITSRDFFSVGNNITLGIDGLDYEFKMQPGKNFFFVISQKIRGEQYITHNGEEPKVTSGCSENWVCSQWSSCNNGLQTRTCTDVNSCGTTVNKPATSQSCTTGPITLFVERLGLTVTPPSDQSSTGGLITSSDGGIYCRDKNKADCQENYASGTNVALTATGATICTVRDPNFGSCIGGYSFSFDHWFGESCLNSTNSVCTFSIAPDTGKTNSKNMYGMFRVYTGNNIGNVFVEATLDGKAWVGKINFKIDNVIGERDTPYYQFVSGGIHTVEYVSGGPAGATFTGITPSKTQFVSNGDAITFRINFAS